MNPVQSSREEWLRQAIEATATFVRGEQATGPTELCFARPGSSEYDFEIDQRAQLAQAQQTPAALQAELSLIHDRARLRAARPGEQ